MLVIKDRKSQNKKRAFTLAEVLITLGIIGIIAAMTLPTVIGIYKKKVVETKLKRFYSVFNNALIRSEADNDTMEFWEWPATTFRDENNNLIVNGMSDYEWFLKYIKPYFNTQNVHASFHLYCVWYDGFAIKFTDGTGVACGIYEGGTNIFACMFFPNSNDIDDVHDNTTKAQNLISGKDYFVFEINNGKTGKKGLQPVNDTRCTGQKGTTYLPSRGCVKRIAENNWEIPDDYPIKF